MTGDRSPGWVVVVASAVVVVVVVVVVEMVELADVVVSAADPLHAVRVSPRATTEEMSRRIGGMLSTPSY